MRSTFRTALIASALSFSACAGLSLPGIGSLTSKAKSAAADEAKPAAKSETASSSSSSSSAPATASGPKVKPVATSSSDPAAVRNAASALNDRGESIANKMQPSMSPMAVRDLVTRPSDDLKSSPRYPELLKQLAEQDTALAARLGGRAKDAIGDGTRVETLSDALKQAAEETLQACTNITRSTGFYRPEDVTKFQKAEADYDVKFKKLLAANPSVFKFVGVSTGGGSVDFPSAVLSCEAEMFGLHGQLEDTYVAETPQPGPMEKRCGMQQIQLMQKRTGGGWTPWDYVGYDPAQKLDCGKLVKASKVPADVQKALPKEAPGWVSGDVAVQVGGIENDQDDDTIPPTPRRYINVNRYSKKMQFERNPCGKESLACEVGGSKAMRTFNELSFAAERAEVHRNNGNPKRCQELVTGVAKGVEYWKKEYGEAVQYGSWTKGLSYRTRKGEVLSEKQLVERFTQLGDTADQNKLGHCDTPAEAGKVTASAPKP